MSHGIEVSWETASGPEKLRLLADNVVTARVAQGNAHAEFVDVLGFYQSEEWRHRGVPLDAVNEAVNSCRDIMETMEKATSVALSRLHDAVLRTLKPDIATQPVIERLVFEAFARHGTDHSIENNIVPALLAEYGEAPDRDMERGR